MQISLKGSFIIVALAWAAVACGGGDKTDLFSDGDGSPGAGGSGTGVGGAGGGDTDGGVVVGSACSSDKDCTPKNQLCDPARSVCVDCLASSDCGMNKECKAGACVAFTPCTSSLQCGVDQVCDTGAMKCVACLAKADCKEGQACVDHECRAACSSDKDCRAISQLCDVANMVCVECLTGADCDPAKSCVEHACVNRACTPGSSACRGTGVVTCNAQGSGYGAVSPCPAQSPCTESGGKASCAGQDAGVNVCSGGTTVWFLVSRSGAMFSAKFDEVTTHWAAVAQAFGTEGPLKDYASKMKIGLSTFAGEQLSAPACPALETVAPAAGNGAAILAALSATVRPSKGETPTTAAFTSVASLLKNDTATTKYIVIIGNAAPDKCADPSTYCTQDELVAAVQSAYAAGIRTKIIGLPNSYLMGPLWTQFLQDVANAGAGQSVAYTATPTDFYSCTGGFKAQYINEGGAPGTAAYAAPATATDVTTAVGAALGSLGCP